MRMYSNISLDEALRINVSRVPKEGLARSLAEKQAELWLQKNQAALDSSNAYVERRGLPLAKYRGF
jgi:antitoxin CcdA